MATAVVASQEMGTDTRRAKRSQAMPKSSLFGSLLEIQDENAVKDFQLTSVPVFKTHTEKGRGIRFTLPDDVRKQLPAAAVLEKSKREFDTQWSLVNRTNDDLKQKEAKVLFERTALDPSSTGERRPASHVPIKHTQQDLVGSEDINNIGLNKNQSYNRDKYSNKPAVHNYSLIGDVLRPGMDFPRRERTDVQMRNQGYGKGDLRGILAGTPPPITQRRPSARTPSRSSIELPPNIKHQFGSKECDKLLSNRDVVDKTIKSQKAVQESIQRRSHPFSVPKFSREINPEYEMLGNALRMNILPGYTTDHKISTTKSAYNDQVHLFRYRDPDKWRYQKDELSKWREARFLQDHLAKGLDSLFENAPKFQRNWDNVPQTRAKTVPAEVTQKRQQQKSKPRTAPKKKETKEETAFEEVVFQTPPRTPSPEKVQVVKNTRDNEFWDFYDKGGAK